MNGVRVHIQQRQHLSARHRRVVALQAFHERLRTRALAMHGRTNFEINLDAPRALLHDDLNAIARQWTYAGWQAHVLKRDVGAGAQFAIRLRSYVDVIPY